ncbi:MULTISPECIES: CoA-acylating methylmalonate-semialdehyde dehydrogenase [Aneurinibacillus]|uniref:methylmalonate-semialdehyde dehydrogenase (CoA acylating) n=1 Tax=Aneurinibacillus danicus TaxID=267746 RepID=A0A511V4B1_9BACL|nr:MULTISPECIES: CoA-acylating methylmalonate-semialdehyde dehydrogenase [Aneurinibacillus]GEN32778.1 methylmalonate semialdehyde dehydrogenase [acylating] 2 [Aneurinibacillus danicus]
MSTQQVETFLLKNFINGSWVDARTDRFEEVINPATDETIAKTPLSSREDVAQAVAAAKAAFEGWRETPITERSKLMFKLHALLLEHQEELAELITKENGKTYHEAYAELLRGFESVEFVCGLPTLMMGDNLLNVSRGIDTQMVRFPLGVVAGITPFNFPGMLPLWMFPLAIACGNTFVLKPSEKTPLSAVRIVELAQKAGVPDGVINIVHGAHDAVNGLLEHTDVKAVSFIGSQPVAEYIYKTASKHGKRVQALAGAKNHHLVMPDADLDKTAEILVNSAFGCAGERCLAASVVVAHEAIADKLAKKIVQYSDRLVMGPGEDRRNEMGPVIRQSQLERAHSYIQQGEESGAKLIRDGREEGARIGKGYFLGPTVFDYAHPDMSIIKDEIFAPVLSMVRVQSFDEGIETISKSRFGNGACVYTNSGVYARDFVQRVEAGMVGVNIGLPAPMSFFPFSGWKDSFYGDLHANGKDGVEFYTKKKVVTTRWYKGDENSIGQKRDFVK